MNYIDRAKEVLGLFLTDFTEEEIAEAKNELLKIPYEQRVVDRIRLKYSVDDELAILRQRDTKPDEFIAYNDFVERIKAEEKEAVSGK